MEPALNSTGRGPKKHFHALLLIRMIKDDVIRFGPCSSGNDTPSRVRHDRAPTTLLMSISIAFRTLPPAEHAGSQAVFERDYCLADASVVPWKWPCTSGLNKSLRLFGKPFEARVGCLRPTTARSSRLDSGLALQDAPRMAVPIRRYGGLMRRIILFASIVRGQSKQEIRRR